jgi:hypothetical protein
VPHRPLYQVGLHAQLYTCRNLSVAVAWSKISCLMLSVNELKLDLLVASHLLHKRHKLCTQNGHECPLMALSASWHTAPFSPPLFVTPPLPRTLTKLISRPHLTWHPSLMHIRPIADVLRLGIPACVRAPRYSIAQEMY